MKLRVWNKPQLLCESFYVPVESVIEAKKVMDILAAYNLFQLERNIKPNFSNTSGLEMFNEESGEWEEWYEEINNGGNYEYYDDVDEYTDRFQEVKKTTMEIFGQLSAHESNV